jgi:hypothetical protein
MASLVWSLSSVEEREREEEKILLELITKTVCEQPPETIPSR